MKVLKYVVGAVLIASCSAMLTLDVSAETIEHDHNGKLKPYAGPPPLVPLTLKERRVLNEDKPVYKSLHNDHGDQNVVIFRINAPYETVWSVITDFQFYPDWVDDLAEATVYKQEQNEIYVRFRIEHWLAGKYIYYIHHTYPWREQGWGTWKLDTSRPSDLEDSIGFWRVIPEPDTPQYSDVTYATAVLFKRWMPEFVRNSVMKKGLMQATSWVKIQAEKRASQGNLTLQ